LNPQIFLIVSKRFLIHYGLGRVWGLKIEPIQIVAWPIGGWKYFVMMFHMQWGLQNFTLNHHLFQLFGIILQHPRI